MSDRDRVLRFMQELEALEQRLREASFSSESGYCEGAWQAASEILLLAEYWLGSIAEAHKASVDPYSP